MTTAYLHDSYKMTATILGIISRRHKLSYDQVQTALLSYAYNTPSGELDPGALYYLRACEFLRMEHIEIERWVSTPYFSEINNHNVRRAYARLTQAHARLS